MTHPHSSAIGALNRAQLARLLEILEPFRHEPVTVAVMALAARLARQEVAQ
ncbi:hypothetical protein [Halomonas sp. JS92-SW72]|uniref:hypothetical protein n=1 Tax=Halomonas sp. JS92-SW72 TaxID=2306583 RepID=UPI0013C32205|nr:hypothetical protein [Halomonas sp. JS92-SW72]